MSRQTSGFPIELAPVPEAMEIKLSLVIPTLNESDYVDSLVTNLTGANQPIELLFVDGGSTDGTREKVLNYSQSGHRVALVDNERRFVNHGFNKAFPQTRGRYVGLLGAHAIYPRRFCQVAMEFLDRNEADVVGGPLKQVGVGRFGKAIARCMSSRFGVGRTDFRTSKEKKFVDTVAFAIYKREIFDTVGLLDEQLVRNQDDELHYRICHHGYRILMVPEMEVTYFVRESLRALFVQYFNYGSYKPLVLRKVRSATRLKHLVPAAFVLYVLSLPIAFAWPTWSLGIFIYICLNIYFSARGPESLPVRAISLIVFPSIHIAYGSGFLYGLVTRR